MNSCPNMATNWELEELPEGTKPLKVKWHFAMKQNGMEVSRNAKPDLLRNVFRKLRIRPTKGYPSIIFSRRFST